MRKVNMGLTEHIRRAKSIKTVCVSNVLGFLGIPLDFYHSTSTYKNPHAYRNVVRRFGYGVRSRKSRISKNATVGSVRKELAKMAETVNVVAYMVVVRGHLMLLSTNGDTIVDTAPRKRDRRKIYAIHAIIK